MKFISVASNRISPIKCNFNYENPTYDIIELEITLDCNLFCKNCNRMVKMFDFGDTNMTIGQIERFISELIYTPNNVKTISVMGGEPLVHPKFLEIWFLLYRKLFETNIIDKINLVTNGVATIPKDINNCSYNLMVWPFETKRHVSFYVAPKDVEIKVKRCIQPKKCGIALNTFGYFPCGAGGSIIRLFDLNMAKFTLPRDLNVWDYNDLCIYCSHAGKYNDFDEMYGSIKCSESYGKTINSFVPYLIRRYPEHKKLFL